MIPLSWALTAGAAVAAFALGGSTAWYVQGLRFDAARVEAAERTNRDLVRAIETQDRAVAAYLKERQDADVVYREIVQEVEVIVERPVYRNVCLDADGLRALQRAINGSAPGPQSRPAVPQPPIAR